MAIKYNKKSLSAVIGTILTLLVVVVAGVGVNNWYKDFSVSYKEKQTQSATSIERSLKIKTLKYENDKYNLYFVNTHARYVIINEILINNNNCNIEGSNVIQGGDLTIMQIDCPSYDIVNGITAITDNGIVEVSLPVKTP